MWCGGVACGALCVLYGVVWCSEVWWCDVWCGGVWCGGVWCGGVWGVVHGVWYGVTVLCVVW